MKKLVTIIMLLGVSFLSYAQDVEPKKDFRPMLVEGKTWSYIYHHFEMKENLTGEEDYRDMFKETMWEVEYTLRGDTVIEGRQYMKMYRWDTKTEKEYYYGVFREDERGRVWQYDYEGVKQDFMICDFTLDSYFDTDELPTIDLVNVNQVLLQRYSRGGLIGVEGVGIENKGLVHYVFEPEPDCICDYESFNSVSEGFYFTNADFTAPRYINLSDEEKKLVDSNNDFAFNLFRKIRASQLSTVTSPQSTVFSPLSITYALGMLNNGAAGQTQKEINEVLGFGDAGADAINAFCRKLLTEAPKLDKKTTAEIANTVFVNSGLNYELQQGFIDKAKQFYDAEPQSLNFFEKEKTLEIINGWASDHTHGMIPEILNEFSFNTEAVSYLLNALYFKGAWTNKFDKQNTKEESFNGGEAVPMMQQYEEFEYTENDLYQAIHLPYGNGAYKMTVFLPLEGKSIDDVLGQLNGSNWNFKKWRYDVDLKLPYIKTSTSLPLVDAMKALGMTSAFTPNAEFPYFCDRAVYIGNMFQKAAIELDEEGTDAAAVTVIEEAGIGIPKTATFHANRPFFYIISEQSTGAIFFMGQYTGLGQTNNITSPLGEMREGVFIYDLSGRKISNSQLLPNLSSFGGFGGGRQLKKGLYIVNGRKVMK